MAAIKVEALYGEVLVSTGDPLSRVTKQAFETAVDNSGTNTAAVIKLEALYAEAIVASNFPQLTRVTKQALEALIDNSGINTAAKVVIEALYAEAIFGVSSTVRVTKQSFEALFDNRETNTVADLKIQAFYGEILARRGPAPPVPLTAPTGLDFFVHNWATEITIRTAYQTDIIQAQTTLTEERRALWSRPIRTLRSRWLQNDPEWISKLVATLRRIPNERLTLPLYQDQMEVTASSAASDTIYCDTTNRRLFVGQRVAVLKLNKDRSRVDTTDLRLVTYMEADHIVLDSTTSFAISEVGTIVMPMIDTEANLESAIDYIAEHVGDASLELTEVVGPSALPSLGNHILNTMQFFNDYPIWNFAHDWSTPLRTRFVRDGRKFTQGRGTIVDAQGDRHRTAFTYKIGPFERDEFFPFVRFFDYCQGRLRPFWVIDQENNWTLDAINGGGTFLDIEPLEDFDDFAAGMDFIGLVLADGTRVVAQVDDVEDLGSVYRLTLNEAVTGFAATDVVQIARARLCRFNTDEMTEVWTTDGIATASIELIEVLEEQDA